MQLGVRHIVLGAHVDETPQVGEAPHDYVQRIARAKILEIWKQDRSLPVLGADTAVVLDAVTYGKPRDRAHALEMLAHLSGRTHEVLTAVGLASRDGLAVRMSVSSVRFRALTAEECAAYWDTGEPWDKAGAYAIQGRAAAFIESLTGSYSGVMGLPLFETAELLRAAGLACWGTMQA